MKIFLLTLFLSIRAEGSDNSIVFDRSGRAEGECFTTSGNPCVFPFEYLGVTYRGCTVKNDPESLPWCSTMTFPNGSHIVGKKFWGHCKPNCPVDSRVVFESSDEDTDSTYEPCTANLNDGSSCEGHCLPLALCTTLSLSEEQNNECSLPNGESGLCCVDRVFQGGDARGSLVTGLQSQSPGRPAASAPLPQIALEDIDDAISVRFGGLHDPANFPEQAAPPISDIESIIFGDGPDELMDDPEGFHLRFNAPVDRTATQVDRVAEDFVKTADRVKNENNLTASEAGIGLRSFDIDSSNEINRVCPWTPPPKCASNARYRSADGTCNNLKSPNIGRAKTPYQRILLPEYSEGTLQLPRRSKVRNRELPSARDLSVQLTGSNNDLDPQFTVLVMQMGQFIDHDLTHTPNHGRRCCDSRGAFPDSFDGSKCFPIPISENDPFWKGKKRCLSLARSLTAPGLKCELEFRQQMNQITHWLDASNIYGSTKEEMDHLRSFEDGRLKISSQTGTKKGSLPSCSSAPKGVEMCRGCRSCFFAGDIRANEQHNLIVMHTIWIREHNRIAAFLGKLNPQWDEEKLFQETRRIVTAEYQHIILKEWLPSILGNEFMNTYSLWPLTKGHSTQYLDIDSRITNEFATAAFRFGHSLIPSKFARKDMVGLGRTRSSFRNLKDIFFKPHQIDSAEDIDGLVRGMTSQEGSPWDNSFVKDIKDHLFEGRPGAGGLDLVAINVQRARDHGIPGYNAYREICQFNKAKRFEDFSDVMSNRTIQKLKAIYNHVDDIDLFVGGFLEERHKDSILGPVFKCIIGDQFARLKLGDRYFYDLGLDRNIAFTTQQLREIRKVSMARIICDNTESITTLQPRAFRVVDRRNAPIACTSPSIPFPNLSVFDEGTRGVDI